MVHEASVKVKTSSDSSVLMNARTMVKGVNKTR